MIVYRTLTSKKHLGRNLAMILMGGIWLVSRMQGLAWGDVTLSHPRITAQQGTGTVVLPLTGTATAPLPSALQVETTYPSALRLTAITTGAVAGAQLKVMVSSSTPTRVRYVIYGMNQNELPTGEWARLTFPLAGVPVGEHPIGFTAAWTVLSNSIGVRVEPVAFSAGAIIVTEGEDRRPPPTPANFQTEPRSPTTIQLTWDHPPRATRIWVDRSETDNEQGPFVRIATVTIPARQYDDGTRSSNTRLFYRLIATNDFGQSAPTAPLPGITHANPPTLQPYSGVDITQLTSNWGANGNPGGTAYLVDLATQPSFSPLVASATVTSVSYPFVGLTPNTTYYSQVRARNLAGRETVPTSLGPVVTLARSPVALPITDIGMTSLVTTWDPQDNPSTTEYLGELDAAESFHSPGITGWITDVRFEWAGLSPGTTYFFRVKTRNHAGQQTPYSNVERATTRVTPAPRPNPPVLNPMTEISSTTIRLTWEHDRQNVGRFWVERTTRVDPPRDFVVIATVTLPAMNYLDRGLLPATTYAYLIRAVGTGGASDPSNTRTAQTRPPSLEPPAAVTQFRAVALTRRQVRITWVHDGQRLTGFRLEQRLTPQAAFQVIAEPRADQRSYDDTSPTPLPLRTITYRIRAVGPGGDSATRETGVVADDTPLEISTRGLPQITNRLQLPVTIEVNREIKLVIDRHVGQGRERILDEFVAERRIERTLRFLDGGNELRIAALDIVNEQPIRSLTERVTVDRDPPRVAATPFAPGERQHRGRRYGIPRVLAHLIARFTKPVQFPTGSIVITQLRDSQGREVNQPVTGFTPVLEGVTLLLRGPDGRQPLALASHAEYRVILTRTIVDAAGNPLDREVPLQFQTTMDPTQHHVVTLADRPTRMMLPPRTLVQAGYVILNSAPLETPLDSDLSTKIQAATDKLHRVAKQFRLVLSNTLLEVAAFREGDGVGQPTLQGEATIAIPYTIGAALGIVAGASVEIQEDSLKLARLNPETAEWELIPDSQVDKANRVVTAKVNRLSVFTLIGSRTPAISAVFAFPVPFQPGLDAGHHTITFANTPKDTVIKVFTVAGDLVRELPASDDTGQVAWDVTNSAGERVASEVYLYVAEKDGERKTSKLVVIR